MASFKGVSSLKIAESIQQAKVFVKELGCNQVIEEHIFDVTQDDINSIGAAASDKDLADRVQKAYGIFFLAADLFIRHGILDTDSKGAGIAINLFSWGAFDGASTAVEAQINYAINQHLQDYSEPTEEQIESFYNSLPPSYIGDYGVECNLSNREYTSEIRQKVIEALAEFADKDDLELGQGRIGSYNERKFGVSFRTSLDGARAVANALSGLTVLDSNGDKVESTSQSVNSLPQQNLEP